jgi:uncharacterized protein (DUF427 family)
MPRPTPEPAGPGQESVWDYPRPPALEPVDAELHVELGGVTVAHTTRGYRVLETSHPPVYYFPPEDVNWEVTHHGEGSSFCEWKGAARYVDVRVGDTEVLRAGWYYPEPTEAFRPIAGYVAFYAGPMDLCRVGEHVVTPQPGEFYGGWITPDVVGPFKGVPGSRGW